MWQEENAKLEKQTTEAEQTRVPVPPATYAHHPMSFLYSWLSPPPAQAPQQDSIAAPSIEISDAHNDEEGNEAASDEPPAFPALSSIQRSSAAGSNVVRVLDKDSIAMPPPPVPSSRIAPASSGGLMSPPVTVKKMPNVNTKKKAREKVALTPGHSPLDWARLKSSGEDLRVSDPCLRILYYFAHRGL